MSEQVPSQPAAHHPAYLVIGPAIAESVTHLETRDTRRDVGAVAGQMATALARHGCDVTLLTSTGRGPVAQHALQMLNEAGVTVHAVPGQHPPGWAHITTRRGEQRSARGKWPPTDESVHTVLPELITAADSVLIDCNISPATAPLALATAAEANIPVTINATTPNKATLIWRTRRHPKQVVAMNTREAETLMRLSRCTSHTELRNSINCSHLLVTHGSDGWRLHRADHPELASPAPAAPRNTDFIGCGDYATAALACALAAGHPVEQTINTFIATRTKLNTL